MHPFIPNDPIASRCSCDPVTIGLAIATATGVTAATGTFLATVGLLAVAVAPTGSFHPSMIKRAD